MGKIVTGPRVNREAYEAYLITVVDDLLPLHGHSDQAMRGGRAISNGKRPRDINWTKRAYAPETTIHVCATNNWNLGVRLGARHLVIDVDPRNGGGDSLPVMCNDLGIDLSKYPHVITGSGGSHYYMSKPADILILDTLENYPGVEFKSLGRQVVAAGSIHPDTKKHYEFDPSAPSIADGLPAAPKRLLRMITRPARGADVGEGGTYSCEDLSNALAALDPTKYNTNDKWTPLLMACHHATRGEGRQEFIDWSTSDPVYAADAYIIGRRWDSLHTQRCNGRTYKTLERELRLAGRPDLQKAGDAASDFEEDGAGADKNSTSEINGVCYQMASDVQPQPISWAWKNRLARGKINFVAGHPDQGKSQITLDIAARVSNGDVWPNNEGRAELGSVVILSAEDDAADTVVPRLMAAGANRERVAIVAATVKTDKRGRRMFNLAEDLGRLTDLVKELSDVSLLVIDPISAYMGGKSTADTYKNTEVRAVLAPLAEWAATYNIAVVFVSHLNKSGSGRALSRLTDSLAFGALARCGWLVVPEQDATGETGRKLFLRGKNNLAADAGGLAYRIEGRTVNAGSGDISAPRIVWEGPVTITADQAMEGAGMTPTIHDAAVTFLELFLADGPQSRKSIEQQAEVRELSWRTIERAKTTLGVKASKVGYGKAGSWVWSLPGDEDDSDFG